MKNPIVCAAVVATLGAWGANAMAQEVGRVISSTPIVQQVGVPRQVCSNQQVAVNAPKSGAGALMGAIAGGGLGNAVGQGGGKALATVAGLMGGAILGNNIEGSNTQLQNVQQCGTQTSYENRTVGYNVVYEYAGRQYNVQMPQDPGQTVQLQVTPVGATNSAPNYPQQQPNAGIQGTYAPQTVYEQPQQQIQTYIQPQIQTYTESYGYGYAPTVVYPYATYAPYYRPYYAPAPVSLSFGFRGGYGGGGYGGGGFRGGGGRHWR